MLGYKVAWLVEALCHKPEGCRFDCRWSHEDFSTYSSGYTMALSSPESLSEMSTRSIKAACA